MIRGYPFLSVTLGVYGVLMALTLGGVRLW